MFPRLITMSMLMIGRPSSRAVRRPSISWSNAPFTATRASWMRALGPWIEKVIS